MAGVSPRLAPEPQPSRFGGSRRSLTPRPVRTGQERNALLGPDWRREKSLKNGGPDADWPGRPGGVAGPTREAPPTLKIPPYGLGGGGAVSRPRGDNSSAAPPRASAQRRAPREPWSPRRGERRQAQGERPGRRPRGGRWKPQRRRGVRKGPQRGPPPAASRAPPRAADWRAHRSLPARAEAAPLWGPPAAPHAPPAPQSPLRPMSAPPRPPRAVSAAPHGPPGPVPGRPRDAPAVGLSRLLNLLLGPQEVRWHVFVFGLRTVITVKGNSQPTAFYLDLLIVNLDF